MAYVQPSALRRPPPPGRSLLIVSKKISASTKSKAEEDISRARSRPFYSRRCKKANPSDSNSMIESLPDELLMEILLRLSADEINDNARLVSRHWRHLIHSDAFVREHLHLASSGLLLTPLMGSHMNHPPIFLTATTQGRLKMSTLSCIIRFPVLCSCNGLALCFNGKSRWSGRRATSFIFNPATKCAFDLPKFPVRELRINTLGMAYSAASMAYKVFGSYHKPGATQFVMLTVGVDKTWRHVKLEGFPPESSWDITGFSIPLITGCFLHWVFNNRVLSLNVETEIVTLTPPPSPALMFPQGSIHEYCRLSTGSSLSLLVRCGELSWEDWEMKPETWEWRKVLPKINLEPHRYKIQQLAWQEGSVLTPIGWVRYPKVLAFFFNPTGHFCIIYNLDTDEIIAIRLFVPSKGHCAVQHRNSLVWLQKC